MIRIVNWLLTRKCNLKCDYCAIVRNYDNIPPEYPNISHYFQNEMSTEDVLDGLERFKLHNPDAFHIFYGGEPLLRKDLNEIIKYCNENDIYYTIISNNTKEIQPLIMKLLDDVEEIRGFTASIDPNLVSEQKIPSDRLYKTKEGFKFLQWMTKKCKDVVAEITVMKNDEHVLYKLVNVLSENGIGSDITFIDIAKNPYYDFSNITNSDLLVNQSTNLRKSMVALMEGDFDIHMKDILLPEIWKILPSELDCEINKSLHNVSVDADGTIRLCLRIRGIFTPQLINLKNLFIPNSKMINPIAHGAIKRDKFELCKKCNHTCQIMSRVIDEMNMSPDDLVHINKRG